jgi:hypothetical protein
MVALFELRVRNGIEENSDEPYDYRDSQAERHIGDQ